MEGRLVPADCLGQPVDSDIRRHMQLRDAHVEEAPEIHAFLCEQGWAHRVGSPDDFARLLVRSQRTAVALIDQRVVGFARGITDGLSNGYLSMVAVAAEHRGKGIGRLLVEHILGPDPGITWVLRAGRDGASSFFKKLGFQASVVAMEHKRRQE